MSRTRRPGLAVLVSAFFALGLAIEPPAQATSGAICSCTVQFLS